MTREVDTKILNNGNVQYKDIKNKTDINCPCNNSSNGYNININETNGGNQDENIKSNRTFSVLAIISYLVII